MGLLNALIESADRFGDDLLPVGYAKRKVTWVVDIDPDGGEAIIHKQSPRREIIGPAAVAGRTSAPRPGFLIDRADYSLGLPEAGNRKEGGKFDLNLKLLAETIETVPALKPIYDWLTTPHAVAQAIAKVDNGQLPIKEEELVTFSLGRNAQRVPDIPGVQEFWEAKEAERLAAPKKICAVCGRNRPLSRIQPAKVILLGRIGAPLSSLNSDAFCSGGHSAKSDRRAALCQSCASLAPQVLQSLIRYDIEDDHGRRPREKLTGRHVVWLVQSEKRNTDNQFAVFWTKRPIELQTEDGPQPGELLPRLTFEDSGRLTEDEMPAYAAQLRDLLQRPLTEGAGNAALPANKFYLGVLSASEGRIIVREWLEQDVEAMRTHVRRYLDALRILHPAGRYVGFPPLPAMLAALQSPVSSKNRNEEKPRLPQVEPDLLRKLLRCIFAGSPPPEALLTRALRCFRVPDPPAEGEQRRRQQFRRMALVAAIKLVFTYNNPSEQKAMEQRHSENDHLSDYKSQSPYLSGCLLALLEAIQSRPGNKVNTTLVDRFYGAASTAPATIFGNLISTATKAHLPKLRRDGKEWFALRTGESININDRMADTCAALNEAGGFKPFLTPEEQGQFALGFYSERAELKPPPRPGAGGQNSNSAIDNSTSKGDQS